MATYNPPNTGAGSGTIVGGDTSRSYGSDEGAGAAGAGEHVRGAGVTGAIGTRLERVGNYLEEKGKAAFISDQLHNAGRYLQEHDIKSITRSVDDAVCTHPYRSMMIGFGVGWFIGKFISR